MRSIFLLISLATLTYASMPDIKFFDADFEQKIVDDKGKTLSYSGHIKATRPNYVFWSYEKPVVKNIYISGEKLLIIEPEIEQVISKRIDQKFNFFNMIKNAKKIDKNSYKTEFNNSEFTIKIEHSKLTSISYKDKFDNSVTIRFSKQVQNRKVPLEVFTPEIPAAYDFIQD